jgi:catechol 2,3-dioxygenase-like lactoylglutathione lyase family enzyme
MGFHHVALATRDLDATHAFYVEAMGFELVKVDVVATDSGGWAKHAFYQTPHDGLMAFWELHDETFPDFDPALSTSHGLPTWVNHLAFHAGDLDELREHRNRWLDCGIDVVEIDHDWCTSIYATDPNGTMVEWCTTTRVFTDDDRRAALDGLRDAAPAPGPPPAITIHEAAAART